MRKNSKLNFKSIVQSRGEASQYLKSPGDAVLIERGRPRWLLLSCPCGCGDEIPINLDSRAGKAWRIYRDKKFGLSLYPSVWRDTDCESHFIIWRDRILLYGQGDDEFGSPVHSDEMVVLSKAVLSALPIAGFVSYTDVADSIDEVPWDVLDALRFLVKKGLVRENAGKQRGNFCRV